MADVHGLVAHAARAGEDPGDVFRALRGEPTWRLRAAFAHAKRRETDPAARRAADLLEVTLAAKVGTLRAPRWWQRPTRPVRALAVTLRTGRRRRRAPPSGRIPHVGEALLRTARARLRDGGAGAPHDGRELGRVLAEEARDAAGGVVPGLVALGAVGYAERRVLTTLGSGRPALLRVLRRAREELVAELGDRGP